MESQDVNFPSRRIREGAIPISRRIALACKVMQRDKTVVALANEYGISKRAIFNYVHTLLNQNAMKEDRGRPRVFDERSVSELRIFFDVETPPDWEAVKVELVNQQRKTWCRLHHATMESISDTKGPRKISKRSLCRYLKMFNYKRR